MTNENKYKYLVLLLSAKEAKLYIYDKINLEKIKLSSADSIIAFERDMPGRMGQFTDTSAHKEIVLNNFLHHIDLALGEVLHQYPKIPLFVLGAKKTTGHFNGLSKHVKSVTKYIDGNYSEYSLFELKGLLAKPIMELEFKKE
jgi:hypothetical protein